MTNDTLHVHPSVRAGERERELDWLTALVPALIMSLLYYRWQALALEVTAIGGYLMAAVLLSRVVGYALTDVRITAATLAGLLAAFCLPATAPWWLSAFIGGVAAAVDCLPSVVARFFPQSRLAKPLFSAPLIGYLLALGIFPSAFAVYTMPVQYATVDGISQATPLALLRGESLWIDLWQLVFGVHAGAIGETCAVALLLGAVYLILRRRLRLIAPACMLASVAVLSWIVWGAPLLAILSGGLLLGTLLLADGLSAPTTPRDQIVVGVVAGVVTVLLRRFSSRAEGVAVSILIATALVPLLPYIYKGLRIFWTWAKPHLLAFFRWTATRLKELVKKKK